MNSLLVRLGQIPSSESPGMRVSLTRATVLGRFSTPRFLINLRFRKKEIINQDRIREYASSVEMVLETPIFDWLGISS